LPKDFPPYSTVHGCIYGGRRKAGTRRITYRMTTTGNLQPNSYDRSQSDRRSIRNGVFRGVQRASSASLHFVYGLHD